jgi:hypothetical protein
VSPRVSEGKKCRGHDLERVIVVCMRSVKGEVWDCCISKSAKITKKKKNFDDMNKSGK